MALTELINLWEGDARWESSVMADRLIEEMVQIRHLEEWTNLHRVKKNVINWRSQGSYGRILAEHIIKTT